MINEQKVNNRNLLSNIDCSKPAKGLFSNPKKYLESTFSRKQLKVVNQLVYFFNKHSIVYVSQATLGKLTGYSRPHTNVLISKLRDLGLINTLYRHQQTCLYKLNPFFHDFYVRKSLIGICAAFGLLTISSLSSDYKKIDFSNLTQLKVLDLSKQKRNDQGVSSDHFVDETAVICDEKNNNLYLDYQFSSGDWYSDRFRDRTLEKFSDLDYRDKQITFCCFEKAQGEVCVCGKVRSIEEEYGLQEGEVYDSECE